MAESKTQRSDDARHARPLFVANAPAMERMRSIYYLIEMDDDEVPPSPAVSLISVMDEKTIASYPPSLEIAKAISKLQSADSIGDLTLDEFGQEVHRIIKDKSTTNPRDRQIWIPIDDGKSDALMACGDCDAREVTEIISQGCALAAEGTLATMTSGSEGG